MRERDRVLERLAQRIDLLKEQYEDAKEITSECKEDVLDAEYWVAYGKEERDESRAMADEKFELSRACWEDGDKDGAAIYSEEGREINERVREAQENLDEYYHELNCMKEKFHQALSNQKEIKEELDKTIFMHKQRVQELKQEWKEKTCKMCGGTIHYNINWEHIPAICSLCRQKEKEKWKEKNCQRCGAVIMYNTDWKHVPNYCKECRQSFEEERKK